VGRVWLKRVIFPLHKEMEKDATVNFCEYFLDTLIREAPRLPRTLKYICHTIDNETKNKPAEGIALRSFLILRFIVPSLMIPKQLDVTVSPETQKKLLVVSKKVQLLANKKLESELELNRQLEQFLTAAKSGSGTDFVLFVFLSFVCFLDSHENNFADMEITGFAFYKVPDVSAANLMELLVLVGTEGCLELVSHIGNKVETEREI
jgi:hypothetical protein